MELGITGPAQSDDLVHFTGRAGNRPNYVPEEIRNMSPQDRLNTILTQERLRSFPPFGVTRPCVCFSECPPDHLAHLVNVRGYQPWGIVIGRDQMFRNGGGAVAYVPDDVYATFKTQGLEHWAVRTGVNSTWMHEREWRLATKAEVVKLSRLRAILIGDKDWRPSLVDTGEWINGETGEQCQGPAETPAAQPRKDYPKLWRETEIWVWDAERKTVVKHPPGTLR